ncbi:MAG: NAD(P)/FAD-dependent oxidoreductase [Mycobacteriaceae bacterium]
MNSPEAQPAHVDVLIVGAGLSGIGAACHLQNQAPGTSYAIVEARAESGGTWDLFRYPGVRSDSDMFTLGYDFKPWTGEKSIVDGADILAYLRETAVEHGVDRRIAYDTKVQRADFDTATARWSVATVDTRTGQETTRTCSFLYLCAGYYRYDAGHTPDWPGIEEFAGAVVHPQHWPADLDVAGKRVVVVGSGATAVTLVPALAEQGAQVTMLQRSPSYLMAMPGGDPIAALLRRWFSPERASRAVRWKNVRTSTAVYQLCRRYPERARAVLQRAAIKALPAGFDAATHFTPVYQPWDQRMCLVPDGDFFAAIRSGRADVVTDHVERFTTDGVVLRSGAHLDADVVVTATGLNLAPIGGIALGVDGDDVALGDRVAYKGMMLDGVPNMAFAMGYTNASWTLKVDLVSAWVARLVRSMAADGTATVTPRLPDGGMATSSFIEMRSGYFERSRDALPLQGDRAPWRLQQHYLRDAPLYLGSVHEPSLERRRVGATV